MTLNRTSTPAATIRGFVIASALLIGASGTALSASEHAVNTSGGMTLAGEPLAIHGYDPVAYFADGEARVGRDDLIVAHDGAAYRFTNKRNKKAFEKDPARYLPAYGGFCAYGVAVGAKFDGDPRVFEIVDGTLYLNLNPDIQKTWREDVPGNITKAEENWTTLRDKDPRSLK